MRQELGRRTVAIVAGITLLLVGGGVAFAYWTNQGAGTGSAATGTNAAVVINQTSTLTTALAPGVAAQPLSGNFDNPNTGPVYVAAVTATVTGTDTAGCGPLTTRLPVRLWWPPRCRPVPGSAPGLASPPSSTTRRV